MAASRSPDASVKNTDDEINFAMEADKCSTSGSGGDDDAVEVAEAVSDAADPFKKPTIFAVPSVNSKRGIVAAASKPAAETRIEDEDKSTAAEDAASGASSGLADERKASEKSEGEGEGKHADKDVASLRIKAQASVLPAKEPPAGKFPPIPYSEPSWGGKAPDAAYALEILKNGTIVNKVPLTHRSYFVVGRLPVCDVSLEHPSISRYHAVIQYRWQRGELDLVGEDRGFYVHDLGSTHGTVVNKNKIPAKTYIRLRVGHVLKFGGSTRLFILQGPDFDEEEESELTVTELRERARKQMAELERRMMGDDSDEKEEDESSKGQSNVSSRDSGCSWGMAEDEFPEEDESEENPFSTEFHEDQEAAYLKDPKKALQGFYDREGEELEFEYEDKSHGSWLCRIKLPVDDAMGRQLVAEVTHTGKKKEAAIHCCLEACRMLEARGLLRQEAVSRKRKKKNWEDEDYYDSDDDIFLDRTGTVERKRQERMKKAGKVEDQPETYASLVAKLSAVQKEFTESEKKLNACKKDSAASSTVDPLDAFMTTLQSEAVMDAVERRKLHIHVADLRKDVQRLRKLVELARPAEMPSLLPSGSSESEKPKKTLPLFGAMKGGSKFKLKTGTIRKSSAKQPDLPAQLFNMKELPPGGQEEAEEMEEEEEAAERKEEEDEEEDEEEEADKMEANGDKESASIPECHVDTTSQETSGQRRQKLSQEPKEQSDKHRRGLGSAEAARQRAAAPSGSDEVHAELGPRKAARKRVMGPSRPPAQLSGHYPEDDPDYCVWMPPADQSGDGRTHLNDKFGY